MLYLKHMYGLSAKAAAEEPDFRIACCLISIGAASMKEFYPPLKLCMRNCPPRIRIC